MSGFYNDRPAVHFHTCRSGTKPSHRENANIRDMEGKSMYGEYADPLGTVSGRQLDRVF